jgi:hypothetical protein
MSRLSLTPNTTHSSPRPRRSDVKAFAESTGKADLATLLSELKADLVAGVTTLAVSGGNASARPNRDTRENVWCCAILSWRSAIGRNGTGFGKGRKR